MGAPRFALRVQRGAFQLIDRADPRRADHGSLFAISDSTAVSSRFHRAICAGFGDADRFTRARQFVIAFLQLCRAPIRSPDTSKRIVVSRAGSR